MKIRLILLLVLAGLATGCEQKQKPGPRASILANDSTITAGSLIPYEPRGSHEYVTVAFNGVPMTMMWDTGCSTTTIPVSEFERMIKDSKISGYDYCGSSYAQIADGSIVETFEFNISSVTFNTLDGQPYVLHDVTISVSPNPNSSNLLGKNIIDQFGEYHRNENQSCFVVK